VGPGVTHLHRGDEVYGATNKQFTGGYAEFAAADAAMLARKPRMLDHIEAASVPVVASTACQMLFDYGRVVQGTRILIHGTAGNVGAYAVQLARRAGARITAAVRGKDAEMVRSLGAHEIIDVDATSFDDSATNMDVVLDTVGRETLERSFAVLRRGGVLVSSVAQPDQDFAKRLGVTASFFLVSVTTETLTSLTELFETGQLQTNVGEVLPLSEARAAHEMLAGRPHKRGKIVPKINRG
jgi:NADPH:quinone reductase-like Zn-dependent oxidoreductase